MADIYIVDNGGVAKSPTFAFTTGTLNINHNRRRYVGQSMAVQLIYDAALSVSAVNLFLSNDGTNWIDYTSDVTVKTPPAGGSERTTGVNFSFSGYEHFRVQLIHSSGTPNIYALLGTVS